MNVSEIGSIVANVINRQAAINAGQTLSTGVLAEAYVGVDKVVKVLEAAKEKLKSILNDRAVSAGGTAVDGGYEVKVTDIPPSPGTLVTQEMVGTFIGARKGSLRLNVKSALG